MTFSKIFSLLWFLSFFILGCDIQEYSDTEAIEISELSQKNGIFFTVENKDTIRFADFPVAFKNFYVPYCATCHSNHWSASDERQILTLNTWEDVLDFGPSRLVLTAVAGGMPKSPVDKVPEKVLNTASDFLSENLDIPQEEPIGSISGITDPEIKRVVEKYCGNCHGHKGGLLSEYNLSTYERWKSERLPIIKAFESTDAKISMPLIGSRQETMWNQSPDDVELLLDWLENGLPNK